MKRGIVDDKEDLAGRVLVGELQEELVEGMPGKDVGESKREVGVLKSYRAKDVSCFALPVGVYARLLSDA